MHVNPTKTIHRKAFRVDHRTLNDCLLTFKRRNDVGVVFSFSLLNIYTGDNIVFKGTYNGENMNGLYLNLNRRTPKTIKKRVLEFY